MIVDEEKALAVHSAWPEGRVYRPLAEPPPEVALKGEGKREYNRRRAETIRAYARLRGITNAKARLEMKNDTR